MVTGICITSWMHRAKDFSILVMSDSSSCPMTGDRWIVTTASNVHPEAIRLILDSSDWTLIVIGQKDTPKDWSTQFSSQKLVYLNFQEQMKSKLRSARFISYGINAQKNLGYLIAIFCGAKLIYEFDGNSPIWSSEIQVHPSLQSATEVPWLAFRSMRSPFVNIYGIFGQPQIWPRGVPLIELQNILEDGWSSLRRNDNETIRPYIQQKIFDFDPDADVVAQLTRHAFVRHAVFDRAHQSIALEPFTFSPYNSENTIHYLNAFWGLYLPVTIHPRVADIWRGFWVQRLLWDIGGHLIFTPITSQRYDRAQTKVEDIEKEELLHDEAGKLVRFLSSWRSNASGLSERIHELITALKNAQFLTAIEATVMRAWLDDLAYIQYNYPSTYDIVGNMSSSVRVKRSAICVTGLTECVKEVWAKNEAELRKRLHGDIDVFLFLSTGNGIMSDLSPTLSNTRIRQARYYNATINIVHQDVLDIDPGFPKTCKYQYNFTKKHKIVPIEQERLAQANCYNIVRNYEKKRNIRYQLLIRARSDSVFTRLPKTFERNGKFNPNTTIIVPDEHHYFGINDRFAIGPIDSMQYYMNRWHQLRQCLTTNVHPEMFLEFVLRRDNITVTRDIDISLVQIPHNEKQCH